MTDPTKKPARSPAATRWMRLLDKEGYRPDHQVNTENPSLSRIHFKAEGSTFDVYLDAEDPGYLQLSLEYGLRPGTVEHELAPLSIANEINTRLKIVKCAVDLAAGTVAFNVECLGGPVDADVLERWLMHARGAAKEFFERLDVQRPLALA
jgi:hypothetical protein